MYLRILNNYVKRIWHLVQVKYQCFKFFRYWKAIGYLYIMAMSQVRWWWYKSKSKTCISDRSLICQCATKNVVYLHQIWTDSKKETGARIVLKNDSSHNKEHPLILILEFFDFPAYTTIVQQFLCMVAKGFSPYKWVIYYTLIYLSLRHLY